MNIGSLKTIALSYTSGDRPSLTALAQEYEERRQREVLEIASVVADVSADSIINLGLEPETNPAVREAFALQYPNVDPASLVGRSADELNGFANGMKGKLFEITIRDRLNNGERVGELFLRAGQTASLAESSTQAGWDLRFSNSDGSVAELIQAKATTSFGYINEAFVKYPDIRIAVPSEIDGIAENILQTDISEAELARTTGGQLHEMAEEPLTDAIHHSAEWAFDAVPVVPALVVALTEGTAVLLGRSTMRTALSRGTERLKGASVFTALGATLSFLDAGVISAPTVASARIMWARLSNRKHMAQFVRIRTEALQGLS